jgi:hypothetical protein
MRRNESKRKERGARDDDAGDSDMRESESERAR